MVSQSWYSIRFGRRSIFVSFDFKRKEKPRGNENKNMETVAKDI